ncbi:GNAT family N-acetyltransferase [Streptomyces sp. DK15]|uniref:GNAT family N-acetyltransferase n=1 Tax=Streptomyces sp. DK15 TaxID=2957499 RepID=UPI0029ACAEEC|nr:GNAT family N-acetyltransferase [Streptomyces sp. DK15]MDX2388743.1 GNAT family N-acetyltransferase [Streptomyces sp. DK15]
MTHRTTAAITRLSATDLRAHRDELAALLVDVVEGGASLGFLSGLDGTVAWYRESKPNGRHRAELRKLMVHPAARGRGTARTLLAEAEAQAARAGVILLFLDTETGSAAERFYRSAGWTEAGTIPDYATDPEGRLRPTTLFHKHPKDDDPER